MVLNVFVYTAKFLSPPGVFLMCKSAPDLGIPAPFADNWDWASSISGVQAVIQLMKSDVISGRDESN